MARRRERIVVDKKGLRSGLFSSKRRAVESMSRLRQSSDGFADVLRELGVSLRNELGYDEGESRASSSDDTMPLSASVERKNVTCRHLAILYQLRLQEAGISSRMEKGALRLFSLKMRHAWNLAREGNVFALIDVAFAEDNVHLVIVGKTPTDVYEKATEHHHIYCPSPESCHRYQIRMHDVELDAGADPALLTTAAEETSENDRSSKPDQI